MIQISHHLDTWVKRYKCCKMACGHFCTTGQNWQRLKLHPKVALDGWIVYL